MRLGSRSYNLKCKIWNLFFIYSLERFLYMNIFESLIDIFMKHHSNDNKGIIFVEGKQLEKYITYKQLYTKSLRILHNLQAIGLKSGDELIFIIDKNEDFVLIFWACILGGIIPVPISMGNADEQKLKLFKIWNVLTNPHLIISQESMTIIETFAQTKNLLREFEAIKQKKIFVKQIKNITTPGIVFKANLNTIAFIQFSSGSTGDPKGVILTHENLLVNMSAIAHGLQLTSEDRSLSWMPLTHDMGLIGYHIVPLLNNITHYIMPTALFIRNPILWMKKTHEHKITITSSPNFGYTYFLKFYQKFNHNKASSQWDLSQVRVILNGAEPISVAVAEEFQELMAQHGMKKNVILCVYGMAEASLAVSFPPLGQSIKSMAVDRAFLSIEDKVKEIDYDTDNKALLLADLGFAVKDCSVKIVASDNAILADKTVGRIFIKGKNVTAGYYNNPEKTKRYLSSDGWLDTGDLGFLHNGRLVVTGRIKDLIFLNGQNYYAQDIESLIYEAKEFKQNIAAACAVFNNELCRDEVVIFFIFKKSLEDFIDIALNIKKYISKQIGLMIDHVIPIKQLPKTTSGKTQRFILRERFQRGEFTILLRELENCVKKRNLAAEKNRKHNPVEEALLAIWTKTLEIDSLSVNDNFFELGGNSLKASLIISLIHQQFNIKIPIEVLFARQTIKELTDYIENTEETDFIKVESAAKQDYYCLSAAQKRFYIVNKMNPDDLRYNLPSFMDIRGFLDANRVEQVFTLLIQRHESLRTYFEIKDGEPIQIIKQNLEFECERYEGQENEIDSYITSFIRQFDLQQAPLFRVGLLKIHEQRYILMIDMHHIITDGTSMNILANEFMQLYQGKRLAPVNVQYKDYAEWQTKLLTTDFLRKQEEYWLQVFDGTIPTLNMPTDYSRTMLKTYNGAAIHYQFNSTLSTAIRSFITDYKITLNIFLLTTYIILLAKYTGQEDIIVGSLTTGRNHIDLQNTVGLFFNTLAIRNRLEGEKYFMDFLEEVKTTVILAIENQDYQFNELIWKLGITTEYGRNPLFDTLFTMQNIDLPSLHIEGLTIEPFENKNYSSKFDVYFDAFEHEDTIEIVMKYLTELYEKATIETLLKHFEEIISQVLANKHIKLNDISLSSDFDDINSNSYREDLVDFVF